MRFFGFGKRNQPTDVLTQSVESVETSSKHCDGFLFQIELVFSIKNVGTAVVGRVLNGSIGIGDTVSFGYMPGETAFTCKVKGIDGKRSAEGGIGPVERATADGLCLYGCALTLDEQNSDRFCVDGYMFV